MVTLVVLSTGILFIFKTFFQCVDYLSRLSTRLYANAVIEERMSDIVRVARQTGDVSPEQCLPARFQSVDFSCEVQASPIENYDGLYQIQVTVSWVDPRQSAMRLSRTAVISL